MYASGWGTEKNPHRAVEYLEQAHALGHPHAASLEQERHSFVFFFPRITSLLTSNCRYYTIMMIKYDSNVTYVSSDWQA